MGDINIKALKSNDLTIDLESWLSGNQDAGIRIFQKAYKRLITIASFQRNKIGNLTITPTEVVHEAYTRLTDAMHKSKPKNSLEFYRLSSHVFRFTCIDYLRKKLRIKRKEKINLPEQDNINDNMNLLQILMLIEEFESKFERQATIFQLSKIIGFSLEETARLTKNSKATVSRDLKFARHWLAARLA